MTKDQIEKRNKEIQGDIENLDKEISLLKQQNMEFAQKAERQIQMINNRINELAKAKIAAVAIIEENNRWLDPKEDKINDKGKDKK